MSSISNGQSPQELDPKGGVTGAMGGHKYWKSVDELANTDHYKNFVEREFPENASELLDPVSRRSFLGLMASSMALAGLTGCKVIRRPKENILPYNNQPEYVIPGKPLDFATTMTLGEDSVGLVVQSHEGRPTKIEGNPNHPTSLGATDYFHQASLLSLYDPERSQKPTKNGSTPASMEEFWAEFNPVISKYKGNQGEGLRFLSGYITSPTTAALKAQILEQYPNAVWHTHEPINRRKVLEGMVATTGQKVNPHYNFTSASKILSIDCDFLGIEVNHLANAKGFISRRNPEKKKSMNRLYVVESNYSLTGSRSDHRLKLKPSEVRRIAWAIADKVFNENGVSLPAGVPAQFKGVAQKGKGKLSSDAEKWLDHMVKDLLSDPKHSLVCVGQHQDPTAHGIAHVINMALGNIGVTLNYKLSPTIDFNQDFEVGMGSLRKLSYAMSSGKVETLIMLDVNPVFTAATDIGFTSGLSKVKQTVHIGLELDDTGKLSNWHLPQSHYLEEWSDTLAIDGTASIVQPLIAPLYFSISPIGFLSQWVDSSNKTPYQIVMDYWKSKMGEVDYSRKWKKWVHDGVISGTTSANFAVGVQGESFMSLCERQLDLLNKASSSGLEILFRQHSTIYDGRFANNAWLQELPDPMTRLTWDNAAIMSIKTAEKFGIKDDVILKDGSGTPLGNPHRPMVDISYKNQKVNLPAYVLPGLSDDTVLLNVGYGRGVVGQVGKDQGFNVYKLQTGHEGTEAYNAVMTRSGETYPLASVQEHWSMEGRDIVRVEDVADEHHEHHGHGAAPSLFVEHKYGQGHQWGMVMDLNKCTGCAGCVTACQAENNIPVVGKKQVILNREMHWIRVDRYFTGDDTDNPEVVHQTIGCQHCEMAPCEQVCPVAATTHSEEGLNDMAYNRCIGTRYCSNNCPYKVRRFNFFNYTNDFTETQKMAQNPDVTVRFRGVMEKCTYCVQRINEARIEFKNKGEEWIPDGAITPACAQSCPTEAITFGNINDPDSRVAKLKKNKRNYDLLAELNTRPRTSFLARVKNVNPAMAKSHHGA